MDKVHTVHLDER